MSAGPAPVALSWSGGKDSALALAALSAAPAVEVAALLTTVIRGEDRVSAHGVPRALVQAQAEALGLPLFAVQLDPGAPNAAYEAAFHHALRELGARLPAVRQLAFGDLFLADVRAYRERLLVGTGYEALFPLWGLDTGALAERFIDAGFDARLVCVDTAQLDAAFAGRSFDRALLRDLPAGVDPCGERGEFHTFVADGPIFRRPVAYAVAGAVRREGRFAYCELLAG